jgi:hypothetical protein
VSRSDDGSGYFVSPSKTVNIKELITDSDPRLHGDALDTWLERNSPVIEDFLTELRRQHRHRRRLGRGRGRIHRPTPDGPLTEDQVIDAAWNGTKIVQLNNESDHGSFGSENLGRLIIERVEGRHRPGGPVAARGAGLHLGPDEGPA